MLWGLAATKEHSLLCCEDWPQQNSLAAVLWGLAVTKQHSLLHCEDWPQQKLHSLLRCEDWPQQKCYNTIHPRVLCLTSSQKPEDNRRIRSEDKAGSGTQLHKQSHEYNNTMFSLVYWLISVLRCNADPFRHIYYCQVLIIARIIGEWGTGNEN